MWSAKLIMMNLGKAVLVLGTLRLQSLGAVSAGSIYVVKTWLLDTDCAMNTGPLTTKLVSAYPVVMKGIFK